MEKICNYLLTHLGEIMVEWNALAVEEPWIDLPEEHRLDNLATVVLELVDAAVCDPADEDTHAAKVRAAVEHGESRRKVGFPYDLIFREYFLLRRAIWNVLRRRYGSGGEAAEAMLNIDAALNVATRASLLGYHREEYAADRPWEQRLQALVHDSPLLRRG